MVWHHFISRECPLPVLLRNVTSLEYEEVDISKFPKGFVSAAIIRTYTNKVLSNTEDFNSRFLDLFTRSQDLQHTLQNFMKDRRTFDENDYKNILKNYKKLFSDFKVLFKPDSNFIQLLNDYSKQVAARVDHALRYDSSVTGVYVTKLKVFLENLDTIPAHFAQFHSSCQSLFTYVNGLLSWHSNEEGEREILSSQPSFKGTYKSNYFDLEPRQPVYITQDPSLTRYNLRPIYDFGPSIIQTYKFLVKKKFN